MTRIRIIQHPEMGYEQAGGDWPWVMVPQGECRSLLLDLDKSQPVKLGNVDQDGFAGNRLNSFLQAKLVGNELRICGLPFALNVHDVAVDVYQPDRRLRVWVSVKRRRKVRVVAHYVEHGPLLRTRTTRAQLDEMIEAANKILLPQANVSLSLIKDEVLSFEQIGKRLGLIVDEREFVKLLVPHALDIRTGPHDAPPLNLFLVRELQNVAGTRNVAGACSPGLAVVEDHLFLGKYYASYAGEVLAHEVGHHFHLPHHTTSGYLMHGKGSRGHRLYRMEIEKIDDSGIRPASEPLLAQPFQ